MSNPGGHKQNGEDTGIPREWNAFCTFIDAHYRLIYTVALAHVRDAETAQEITQDVCVRLLLEREKLPPMANASGWVARVSRNTAIDWIRRRQTHSRILATMESWNHNPTAGNYTPQDARTAAIMEEEKQRLYTALEHIAPEDREMLLMHYLDGVEKQDIARLLEVHPSTVGRRIDKALRELQKSMTDFEPTKLRSLRPAEHSSRGVLATLSAVAALGAAEKAAIAAVAAPLPVLSAGNAAAVSHLGIAGKVANWLTLQGQITYRFWIGCATVLLLAVTATQSLYEDKPHKTNWLNVNHSTDEPNLSLLRRPSPRTSGSRRSAARYTQRGVTSNDVQVLGYLPITTTQTTTLRGQVIAEDGQSIAGAEVTVWIGNTTSESVKTRRDGSFVFESVETGTAMLTATANGFAPSAWGEYIALMPMPGLDDPLTIQLERPDSIEGTVVDESGQPLPGTTVTVVKQFDRQKQVYNGAVGDLKQGGYWKGPLPQQSVLTDSKGRFELLGLKPGYVSLHVQHSSRPDIIAEEIKTATADALVVLDPGIAVEGRVLDGLTPLVGVQVTIKDGIEAFSGIVGTGASAVTDESGRFAARGLQVRRTDLAEWSFTAIAETSRSVRIPRYLFSVFRGEGTQTLEMNSSDAEKLDGLADTIDVRPFYGSRTRHNQFGSSRLVGSITLPADLADDATIKISSPLLIDMQSPKNGRFVFEKLPPGNYEVSCSFNKVNTSAFTQVIVPQTVDILEGQLHTVHLQSAECTVKGKVLDSAGTPINGTVNISTTDKMSPFYGSVYKSGYIGRHKLSDSGEFEFRGLLPGKYHLAFSGTGLHTSRMIECVAGKIATCDLLPEQLLRVRGKVARSDGQPSEGIRVAFESRIDVRGKLKRSAAVETDSRGNFDVHLSTGSYTMLVQPREKIFPETFDVEVRDGQTTVPLVTLGQQPASGIVVKQTGVGAALWRTATFDLVRQGSAGTPETIRVYPVTKTHDTATLSGIEPGNYGLIVRSNVLDGWPQHPEIGDSELFASVKIPTLTVEADAFAVVSVPIEAGRTVSLTCFPGHHQVDWVAPRFWIKDSRGDTMLIDPERMDLATHLGLSPGKYEFGVTLDSGKTQSVDFDVSPSEPHLRVELYLK